MAALSAGTLGGNLEAGGARGDVSVAELSFAAAAADLAAMAANAMGM